MNLRTTETCTTIKRKRNSAKKRTKDSFSFAPILKIAVPLIILFSLAVGISFFFSESEKLSRKAINKKIEIKTFDREIANLNITHEKLKGRFILEQVKRFKLQLHCSRPHQIKKLIIKKPVRERTINPESLIISQRL